MDSPSTGSSDLILQSATDPSNHQLLTINTDSHQLTGQCLSDGEVITVFATIIRDEQGPRIECSTAGLSVNQQPTQSSWLNQGDIIQVGYSAYNVVETGVLPLGNAQSDELAPQFGNAELVSETSLDSENVLCNESTDTETLPENLHATIANSGLDSFESSTSEPTSFGDDANSPLDLGTGLTTERLLQQYSSSLTDAPAEEFGQRHADLGLSSQNEDSQAQTSLSVKDQSSIELQAFEQVENDNPDTQVALAESQDPSVEEQSFEQHAVEQQSFEQHAVQQTMQEQQAVATEAASQPESQQSESCETNELLAGLSSDDASPERSLEKLLAALKSVDSDDLREHQDAQPAATELETQPQGVEPIESALPSLQQEILEQHEVPEVNEASAAPLQVPTQIMSHSDVQDPESAFAEGAVVEPSPIPEVDRDAVATAPFEGSSEPGQFDATGLEHEPAESDTVQEDQQQEDQQADAADDIAAATAKYFAQINGISSTEQPGVANSRPDLQAPSYLNQSQTETEPVSELAQPALEDRHELENQMSPQTVRNEDVASMRAAAEDMPVVAEIENHVVQQTTEVQLPTDLGTESIPQPSPVSEIENTIQDSNELAQDFIQTEEDGGSGEDLVNSWRDALSSESDASDGAEQPIHSLDAVDTPDSHPEDANSELMLADAISSLQSTIGESADNISEDAQDLGTGPMSDVAAAEPNSIEEEQCEDENSVAAVLARMQLIPELGDSGHEESEPVQEFNTSIETPSETPSETLSETPDELMPAETVDSDEPEENSEDVQSYMNSLLQRLNGDESDEVTEAKFGVESNPVAVAAQPSSAPAKKVEPPVVPMRAEEFVPRSVAPEVKSNMLAMRELANAATQNALVTSEYKKSRTTRTWLLTTAISGFLGSIFFWLLSHNFADIFSIAAMLCIVAGLVTGTLYGRTQLKIRSAGN